jgi:small subunit ribosomal protein S24e
MEVEIQSKTNNPLLKRTEIHFTVHHENEKTPKRELIRSELAEKLNVKKENVIVNFMKSSFGSTDTVGYAKVFKSVKEAGTWEKKYALKRNNVLTGEKKPAKEEPEKPVEQPQGKQEETAEEPKKEKLSAEQDVKEETKKTENDEKPAEEKTEEAEKPKEEGTTKQSEEETAEEKKE